MRGNKAFANIDIKLIESKDIHELLEITIGSNLIFETNINKLCKRPSQKLNALTRISNCMAFEKRKMIMKAFITSQFSYCPLVWMFHSKRLGKKINVLHERVLKSHIGINFSHLINCLKRITLFQSKCTKYQIMSPTFLKMRKN